MDGLYVYSSKIVPDVFTAGYALREAGAFDYKFDPYNKESIGIYISRIRSWFIFARELYLTKSVDL